MDESGSLVGYALARRRACCRRHVGVISTPMSTPEAWANFDALAMTAESAKTTSPLQFRILGPGDDDVLSNVAPGVFDYDVDARWTAEFLADPRHHIAVAMDGGVVVGMASGLHYVHPDKQPELWINEVGVAPEYQRQGVARRLLSTLFVRARQVGCVEAWVLTDRSNEAALRLYEGMGGSETPEQPVMFAFWLGERRER